MKNDLTNLTLKELKETPTIEKGHFEDLKLDDGTFKVWLSRMTVADGAEYNNQVTVKQLSNGKWYTIAEYEAKGDS